MSLQTTPLSPAEYIAGNVAAARAALASARSELLQRPALVATPEVVARALSHARNAAEHLYDADQVDEPAEAVREALAAAESIMIVVEAHEHSRPGIVPNRTLAADQFAAVDATLISLERRLRLDPAARNA